MASTEEAERSRRRPQPPRTTPKKKINPKNLERQREREEDLRKEEKRKGGGKRGRDKALPSSPGTATKGGERGGKQRILKIGWRASLSKK
jgi:hypothetical protein